MNISKVRKNLIILGTGWGSYSVLKNINKNLYNVIVVSPRNHFLFTPLLCSTTVGTLEFRSIVEPVRNVGFRQSDHFHLAKAVGADLKKRSILCQSVIDHKLLYKVEYDKLVIGVGSLNNTFGVPGVAEHAFFLKELDHARDIRTKLLGNFELALQPGIDTEERKRLLHTVIVGGGPTGVEFGAELYDFVKQDVSKHYKQEEDMVQVTLIESTVILRNFDDRLRAYAEKKISQRRRFNMVKSAVTDVKADRVILQDGTEIPCGLVVWSTGLAPQPFSQILDAPKNIAGQILTDEYLRVKGDITRNSYAIGDCASIDAEPLPCTAQVAERQGRYLAECLNREGEKAEPFKFRSLGMLAYIGGYKAVSDIPDFKLKGVTSWFLWRSAYLTRLGSWRLRMQVPMDWLKTLLFGRDITRF